MMKISEEDLKKMIDQTLLKPEATSKDIEKLCNDAALYGFGAVCVRPGDVKQAYGILKETDVEVCTVIGFPWGIQTRNAKITEAEEALSNGATELDMVINRKYLKEKDYEKLKKEISHIVVTADMKDEHKNLVKVILETCKLTDDEIVQACLIAEEARADYVKTSTGLYEGATIKHVKLMKKTVPSMGVKASGGIKTWEDAYKMIKAGATRLGTSSGIPILEGYKESEK